MPDKPLLFPDHLLTTPGEVVQVQALVEQGVSGELEGVVMVVLSRLLRQLQELLIQGVAVVALRVVDLALLAQAAQGS